MLIFCDNPDMENAPFPIAVTELGMIVLLQPAINSLLELSMIALQSSRES